ncbi:hypothetical protein [Glycomyces sp. NPDC021274]|uniref:hypothetical protein n=1 Tax=Glycomyces sp. NPDC021274 TaxID=3155120 RepID=UPI0033C73CF1
MDPILLTIATAAAGKAAEVLAQNGADVTRKVVDLVRKRFGGDAPAEIEAAVLEQTCEADPVFRSELEGIVGRPIQITNVKFQNNFHGGAPKNVVQAETINGLTLN